MTTSKSIFHHKHPFTIGVEEEYMLCHPETGELINRANEIISSLSDDLKPRFSYELILSDIEIHTSVCNTVKEAVNELRDLRKNIKILGERFGYRIGISGTHPTAICKEQKFVKNESYEWVTEQLNYYARRNITFATHVHVAVENEDYAIHVANSMRQWIAPLLALSTNSPFFESDLTGLRSSRTFQFGVFPRTNIPVMFKNFTEYKNVVENYLQTNTIQKSRQIWWKIRPHLDFGTIEFRICDAQRSLKRIGMLAALSQALIFQASNDYKNGTLLEAFHMEYLYDGLWKATRFPFEAKVVDPATSKICSLKELILKMMNYSRNALIHFDNLDISPLMRKSRYNKFPLISSIK